MEKKIEVSACANCGTPLSKSDVIGERGWCPECRSPHNKLSGFLSRYRLSQDPRQRPPLSNADADVEFLLFDSCIWNRDRTLDENQRTLMSWLRQKHRVADPCAMRIDTLVEILQSAGKSRDSEQIPPTNSSTTLENSANGKPHRRLGCNARMLQMLQENPEAFSWSTDRWHIETGFAKSTIARTPTWENTLRPMHLLAAAQRASDRGRNGNRKRR